MSLSKINGFPSDFRLLSRSEFFWVWDRGKRFYTNYFIVVFVQKNCGPTRLGITVSKKVGGAVQRNRIKRLVREFFRLNYNKFSLSVDISIIAKKGVYNLVYDAVYNDLKKLLTG